MNESFFQIDLPALVVAVLTAVTCALAGNFLLLRRQTMIGDALSHVVLPGIAAGFLLSGAVSGWPMLVGALAACLIATALIEAISRYGNVERGAAMGIVFTGMFALGIFLLEKKIGARVHLDAHHALYGALELVYWPSLKNFSALFSSATWNDAPEQILLLLPIAFLCALFVTVLFKELQVSTFDPLFAHNIGFRPGLISAALVLTTALAAVAAFGAVGSILVIAMFVCPAATAYLLAARLKEQILLSLLFAAGAAFGGYGLAVLAPPLFGFPVALNAAAMIALTAGAFQMIAIGYVRYFRDKRRFRA